MTSAYRPPTVIARSEATRQTMNRDCSLGRGHDGAPSCHDEAPSCRSGASREATFKENCPDLRNTRVVDIVKELADYHVQADVFDPWANAAEAQHEYGITPVQQPEPGAYNAVIIAVAHRQFKDMGATAIRALGKPGHVLYDLKYLLPAADSDLRL